MSNNISPPNGVLLPTQSSIKVGFVYDPDDPADPSTIKVNWISSDENLKFFDKQTETDDQGHTDNEIFYDGETPATRPRIVLKNADTGEVLISVAYNFKLAAFVNNIVSCPKGIHAIWPASGDGQPAKNGVQVSVRVVDPTNGSNDAVGNFHVVFSSENNALKFYQTNGQVIPPQPSLPGYGTLRYSWHTNGNGDATVIAMPASPGIFSVNVGYASDNQTATGRIAFLNEAVPSAEKALAALQIASLDTGSNKIQLDETPGPTFPAAASAAILKSGGGPVQSTDPVVVFTYATNKGPAAGVIAGDIVLASALVAGVDIAKGKLSRDGSETSFCYMASDGAVWWQSRALSVGATGDVVTSPDITVPRLHGFPPHSPFSTALPLAAILGGLPMWADMGLLTRMGLSAGDDYEFNVYLTGWAQKTGVPRNDYFSRKGKWETGDAAIVEVLPQSWFTGYESGVRQSTVRFEFVGYPSASANRPVYSAVLSLPIEASV